MSQHKPISFNSFAEFYPYYLSEHENSTSRRLHFFGTLGVISIALCVLLAVISLGGCWHCLYVVMALLGWDTLSLKKTAPRLFNTRFTA